jgi:hypothetical protein
LYVYRCLAKAFWNCTAKKTTLDLAFQYIASVLLYPGCSGALQAPSITNTNPDYNNLDLYFGGSASLAEEQGLVGECEWAMNPVGIDILVDIKQRADCISSANPGKT